MNKKTLLCINEFIIKGLYDDFVNKPFITLFENYANKEVKKIESKDNKEKDELKNLNTNNKTHNNYNKNKLCK